MYMFCYDVETGGLSPETTDLLTLYGAIVDEDMKIIDEIDLKLKPEGRLPVAEAKALEITGIDIQKHLADPNTITYTQGKDKLVILLKKYLKKKGKYSNISPMGYNILGFDNGFTQYHLLDKSTWDSIFHYKSLDVMQEVDMLKRHGWLPPSVGNLLSVVDFFGVPRGQAHVAKDDILMTIAVWGKIHDLMESKKNGGATTDLISLLEAE
jgi:DNA polymerase III alpha subunit (gram-positive type)